jgi:hypothetical protein
MPCTKAAVLSLKGGHGNLLDSRRTIEYRYFDSSLDPARLQANIKLACWITGVDPLWWTRCGLTATALRITSCVAA